jgi:signal transduction histidine kinase
LSIVRTLVELHGGSLAIESDLGRGTRVRVSVPATRVLSSVA